MIYRLLDGNVMITMQPLTFGRWRVTVAQPQPYDGEPNFIGYDDAF